jgi:hypothetical protein
MECRRLRRIKETVEKPERERRFSAAGRVKHV